MEICVSVKDKQKMAREVTENREQSGIANTS